MEPRLQRALRRLFSDIGLFSAHVLGRPLRAYQLEVAHAVVASVLGHRGLTFTVMLPRQSGKNELSAHLEAYLLVLFQRRGGQIVKASPTYEPQSRTSLLRLQERLANPWTAGRWRTRPGHALELGMARVLFLSAEPAASVVGATADLLLEIDEAQDVDTAVYAKRFRPMGASANATTVLYGTAWTADTLLGQEKRRNLAAEAMDGMRRHFQVEWRRVAQENPLYGRYVEGEMARLGADHVIIRTQYGQEELEAGGGLFSAAQRLLLRGGHGRLAAPRPGRVYVGGLDVASADEQDAAAALRGLRPRHDSTVLLIAELAYARAGGQVPGDGDGGRGSDTAAQGQSDLGPEGPASLPGAVATSSPPPAPEAGPLVGPRAEVVEAYWNPGPTVEQQYGALEQLVRRWGLVRLYVDATGIGQPLANWLRDRLGASTVMPHAYTQARKSEMGYGLLALINGGRLAWWDASGEGVMDRESEEFWREVGAARYELLAGNAMRWYVPESAGHDDFLSALGLLALAATDASPPAAEVVVRPRRLYAGEARY